MELIERLLEKQDLDASDAQALLQFLQERTASLLSRRGAVGSGLSTSRQTQGKSVPGAARKQHRVAESRIASEGGSSRTSASSRRAERNREPEGRGKGSFDLSSLMEFPPMQSASASSGKKKGRTSRRITLTPIESQSQPTASQFSSPKNPWRADPAFTACRTPSSTSPLHLNEERRLLQLERSRQRHQGRRVGHGGREQQEPKSRSSPRSAGLAAVGSESTEECNSSAFNRKGRSDPKSFSEGDRVSQGSSAPPSQLSAPDLAIDAKISRHSIFELTQPSGQSQTQTSTSGNSGSQLSIPDQSSTHHELQISFTSELSSQESPTHIPPSTTAPITSTPLLLHTQAQIQPSPTRVTSKESLEKVANIYGKVINERLVPNLTSEIHFVIQLLTVVLLHSVSVKLVPTELFGSLDNCVYFAVAVLNRMKHLLTALDKSTLQLLAENIRITEFDPELAAFFAEAVENVAEQSSSHHGSWSQEGKYSMGVPFQEDVDNCKNFPNLKSFHAFKKQRDSFYFVLREWERNHERSNWNLQAALGEKIRQLIRQPAELCSHTHFARLFQKQLTESCRFSADALAGTDDSSSLHDLRKADPDRFMKLSERFLQPSSGHGPCPPPTFSQSEEFFSEFILTADSYTFNHHLMAALYTELMKLHSDCSSLQARDIAEVFHTMQVLAKFLGFLEFLPYKTPSPDSLLSARAMFHSFDLLPCVHEAAEHGHLCITLPWVVQHLSMMDPQAPLLQHYSILLQKLVTIYRSIPLENPQVNCGLFLIITTLGWLFEITNLSNTLFEYGSTSFALSDTTDGLDSQNSITTEMLYASCPFLGDIRSMLAEFSAGLQPRATPIRKIKPLSLSTEADGVIDQEISPAKQLQLQLQESFFRAHPPYLKQLCIIISERVAAKLVHHCELHVIPKHSSEGIKMLAEWVKEKCIGGMDSSSEENEPFGKIKVEADRELAVVAEDAINSATHAVKSYTQSECNNQVHKTMELLLSGTQSDQVIAAVSGIAATWVGEKCSNWASEKLRVSIQEELIRGFEKLQKTVKSAVKGELPLLQRSSIPVPSNSVPHPLHSEDSKEPQKQPETPVDIPQALQLGGKGLPTIGLMSKDSSVATSREISATCEGSPLEKFRALHSTRVSLKTVTDTIIHKCNQKPTAGQLETLDSIMIEMTDYSQATSSVLPTITVPQLLPSGLQDTLLLSVDLASHLILYGVFTEDKAMKDLLREFVAFWKLTKILKLEFPIEKLMSHAVFERYTRQRQEGWKVWRPLSRVLMVCVLYDLVASPVIEALWLCRKQQQQESVKVQYLLAAAVFLDVWYTETIILEGLEDVCVNLREIHFVRLLSVVLQELNICNIPNSVLSRSHLKGVVHPF